MGFPGGSVVKNPPANAGDAGLVSRLGRSPGEENGNSLSILAWKIQNYSSSTEESIGWQSMGSQTVREDLLTTNNKQQSLRYVLIVMLVLID